ncbi:NusG domain II-containing protein [Neobacillus sp. YIM B02564]|uniref:NusG domain II-containing protein n=1 Tax=Neobacillus paridis TaxID=2803862 RepID=A0ABS1TRI8_9BACI|nr:NusG domain II-containing protein [Neobacillus paridis]MBL4953930.1 NusG domain II-containing protein [Neobacillus paridis]
MRKFKKGDLFFIFLMIALLIIATLWLWNQHVQSESKENKSLIAEIKRDGRLVDKINLNKLKKPKYIKLEDGIHLTVLAEKGRIRVLEADCPNKICVKTGWLTKPGDMAICVPSNTTVSINVP